MKRCLPLLMLLCAMGMWGQPFSVDRQGLCIKGAPFAHRAGTSNVNYLYMDDIAIARGQTVAVSVYLHSTMPIWMWQADVVMPEGVTVVGANLAPDFEVLDCASEYTFDSGEVDGVYRLLLFNIAKTKSLPAVSRLRVATILVQASDAIMPGDYAAWIKNFCFVSANDNSGVIGANKSCTLTVAPIPVSQVTLDRTTAELKAGETLALHATVQPDDATNPALTWRSNNTAVATVDQGGLVTARAVGTANITATATDGSGQQAVCRVTVTPTQVSQVVVTPSTLDVEVDSSVVLTATVLPSAATNKVLTWRSSNTAVATVDSHGEVTARAVGTATITATATDGSGAFGTCQLSVNEVMVQQITLAPASAELHPGDELTINATVLPSNTGNATLTWRSSNASVATVTSSGVVKAIGVGVATITATATDGSGKSATCRITVTPVYVSSITLSATSIGLEVGTTSTLSATVFPANATDRSIAWSSSNTTVATVNNNGVVTARAIGTATITAMAQDGSDVTATCQVKVIAHSPGQLTAPELTITRAKAGQLFALPLTLTLPGGSDFTNIEFHFTYPDGLRPIADADGLYGYEGTGVPLKGRTPVLAFSDNFEEEEFWPDQYVAVGANVTLTPITTNPCQVYTLNVAADADFVAGDRQMLIYSKYTDSANDSYTIGTNTSRVVLTTIHFVDSLVGDVNGDGSVDIYDVNALVNIILEIKSRDDYDGEANVDGDANDKVDIDDVNALINIILQQ